MLKTIVKIIAFLLIFAGVIWILQGMNILPGSYMTGDPQWAINGVITVLIGTGLIWFTSQKK